MSKHTPGPWEIGYGGGEGDDYAVITSPLRNRAICNLEPRDYEPANARLIAAAPELLEALEELLGLCDLEDQHGRLVLKDEATDRARAAIAKAKGE